MSETIHGPCSEHMLYGPGRHDIRNCLRRPTIIEDDKPWCAQHAPSAKAKRDAVRKARWDLERERDRARWDEESFAAKCAALAKAASVTQADLDAGRVRVIVEPTPTSTCTCVVVDQFGSHEAACPYGQVSPADEPVMCSGCGENPGEERCQRCGGLRFCPSCLESHERDHRGEDEARRKGLSIDAGMEAAKEARHRR